MVAAGVVVAGSVDGDAASVVAGASVIWETAVVSAAASLVSTVEAGADSPPPHATAERATATTVVMTLRMAGTLVASGA